MIIRKFTDYSDNGTIEEKYLLLIEERDEGWELSQEEMQTLYGLMKQAIGQVPLYIPPAPQYPLGVNPLIPYTSPITTLLGKESPQVFYDLEDAKCPDFIEPPESTETVEKVQNEVENAQKRVVRDFTPYIEMSFKAIPVKEIIQKIEDDFKVSHNTAYTYYYSKVVGMSKKQKEDEKLRSMEAEKKQLERKLQKKINSDPLTEDIASLPDYGSYSDFKDMCSMMDIGRGKHSLQKLKEIYLKTHPNIKW